MLIVSSREFREKQKSYFDRADRGEEIIVRRGKDKSYKIVPVTEDDTVMSKEEFYAKIEKSAQSIKEGKGKTIRTKEELLTYLESL